MNGQAQNSAGFSGESVVHTMEQDIEWFPEQIWTLWRREKLLIPLIICKNPPAHNLVLVQKYKSGN
jgi:hypothetical protein